MSNCELCKNEYLQSTSTTYGDFVIELMDNKLHIRDDWGHDDSIKIKYCPFCGRCLNERNQI